jgi:putative transposase
MKDLAAARPRYGYRRIHTLLKRQGWSDIKRVYRFYRLDGLAVRSKPRKKPRAVVRVRPQAATAPRQRWAIDFVHDTLADGRPFRVAFGECARHADGESAGEREGGVLAVRRMTPYPEAQSDWSAEPCHAARGRVPVLVNALA